jgi:hypothetical protein
VKYGSVEAEVRKHNCKEYVKEKETETCSCTLPFAAFQLIGASSCNIIQYKAIPVQVWISPEGSKRLRLPGFSDNRHMKVVRLSALRTGRLYTPRKARGYSFLLKTELTPGPDGLSQ